MPKVKDDKAVVLKSLFKVNNVDIDKLTDKQLKDFGVSLGILTRDFLKLLEIYPELKEDPKFEDMDILKIIQILENKDGNITVNELAQFLKLPQGNHMNNLAHKLATREIAMTKNLEGTASIIDEDFKLYIKGYDKLTNGGHTSAVKLLDALVINCSRNQNSLAKIPLKKYMELRELKDEKEARKQIKNDMEVLKSIKFEYKGIKKRKGDWLNLSLYGGRDGIYRGTIEFRFTPEFYSSIPNNQFMYIPPEYFSIKDRCNPHSSYFIRRISEHKRMNLGKTDENIIGVKTLINSSPIFPRYDETKGSHFAQLILEPFERDMDILRYIKWNYTENQPTNYNEFINSNILITWVNYPDVEKLTEQKTRSIKDININKKQKKEG